MVRSFNEIQGYAIAAADGEVGTLRDILFDDTTFLVRYLVADTGAWLREQLVLLPPVAIAGVDWETSTVATPFSREVVENSPEIDAAPPVSRQATPDPAAGGEQAPLRALAGAISRDARGADEVPGDPRLRSLMEIRGYALRNAADEELGTASDFLVEIEGWSVVGLVADFEARSFEIANSRISHFSWSERTVTVDAGHDEIARAPDFSVDAPAGTRRAEVVYDYRGRPVETRIRG